jgi:hypothetical protein
MKKYYYSAVIFYLVSLSLYVTLQYYEQRSALMSHIDERLIQSANVTDHLLSPQLHTPDTNAGTLSPEQDRQNRLLLSKIAQSMKVKYVYTFVKEGEKVYFTSSSATPEELKSGKNISYFFDEYTDPSAVLMSGFKTRAIQFDDTVDQWGHFRSVYIPHVSPSGRLYLTGADIEISNIDAQLNELFKELLGEAFFYILIITPLFLVYRVQNRSIQHELSTQVAQRTADLQERSVAIERLLNNANQGFLTFSTTLSVENEYSRKCLEIFGFAIAGHSIGALLYPEDLPKREFFEQTVRAVLEEEDAVKTEAILSLLQHEFIIGHKAIDVAYKRLDSHRFMVILTDITDKKNLEKNIERERQILKMVVSIISNSDEFFELYEEYQTFLEKREASIDTAKTPHENLSDLYRIVHTYKGLFAQKEFITTPQGLHKVETKLSQWLKEDNISHEMIRNVIKKIDFEGWLSKDLAILRSVLGEAFLEKKTTIAIDDETYTKLHRKIVELLETQPDACHDLWELLEVVRHLKYKPIREYFHSFPKYVGQIADRLDKPLYPDAHHR